MWMLLESISTWLQIMKRFCRLSDYPFPKVRKNTKIFAAISLPLYKHITGVGWGGSLWSGAEMRIYSWAIFFLICSFSCKTQNARVRDNVVAGTISAGWLRVLRREADLNLKTHWGEEMVWLHLVRLASWVYTWVNKKIPLFMSAGLARHHGRGMEVFISQGPPHRATMSIGMRQVFGS